ncbi:MAG: hypothetical protein NVSMB17_03660 [Candidatus Dormibacteria bacterium]
MINPKSTFEGPARPRSFRVIQGGQEFDLAKFADTLTMLESYVDSMLLANDLPAMDPWTDEDMLDARLASI